MKLRIAVVGGGASGLAAAIAAARCGAQVTVLERGRQFGRKILASGGGRCNFTNSCILPERYHGGSPDFIREAISRFGFQEALAFFSDLGLLAVEERDGRVLPRCGKAQAVLDVLKAELERLGVEIRLGVEAAQVLQEGGGFIIKTVAVPWKDEGSPIEASGELSCDRVILACGGISYPQLGAGEGAYTLARSLGHTVTALSPAQVPLCVKENALKRLHGLRVKAAVKTFRSQREAAQSEGEVLFTDYGISGPAALDVSRAALRDPGQGPAQGSLNLFPESSPQELRAMIEARWTGRSQRPLKDFFLGMFPAQLSGALMDALSWDARRSLDSLGREGPQRVAALLQDWRFEITAGRPWSEAMVTAGGVNTDEVDPHTFESRKVGGLYLTGELLDVDGDSGGFNLHFAWASGLSAGRAAAIVDA